MQTMKPFLFPNLSSALNVEFIFAIQHNNFISIQQTRRENKIALVENEKLKKNK